MRRVTCKDCHKQYDYDKDDFCPKCGSFNQPGTETRATPRAPALQPAAQSARSTPPPANGQYVPHSVTPQYSGASAEVRSDVAHSARLEECAGCEETPRRRGRPLLVAVVILLALATLAVTLVPRLVDRLPASLAGFTVFSSGGESAPAIPDNPPTRIHETYESFALNDAEVSVDSYYVVDLSTDPNAMREGYDCLAVELWVEGGTRRSDLRIDIPTLLLSDGTTILPETDPLLKRRLRDNFGLFPVALSDYQWEDPLYGELIYYVPTDLTEAMTLQILEYAPGDVETEDLLARHLVVLILDP